MIRFEGLWVAAGLAAIAAAGLIVAQPWNASNESRFPSNTTTTPFTVPSITAATTAPPSKPLEPPTSFKPPNPLDPPKPPPSVRTPIPIRPGGQPSRIPVSIPPPATPPAPVPSSVPSDPPVPPGCDPTQFRLLGICIKVELP